MKNASPRTFAYKLCDTSIVESSKTESTRNSSRPSHSPDCMFDLAKLSHKDDGLSEAAEEMLSILHFTINKEFNLRAGGEDEMMFNLPFDIQETSLGEQLDFIKDLVYRVCRSYLQVLMPSDLDYLADSPNRLSSRRVSKNKSVVLSQEDCEALCELLRTPVKGQEIQLDDRLSELQAKYKELGQRLLESQALLRKKEDEMDYLIDTNNRLRVGCKLMKQQIRSLERQLVDNIEETYRLEDSLKLANEDINRLKSNYLIDECSMESLPGGHHLSTPSFVSVGRFSFSNYL